MSSFDIWSSSKQPLLSRKQTSQLISTFHVLRPFVYVNYCGIRWFVSSPRRSQGTGAVTLASLQAAVGITSSKLSDQKIVIFGAGTAGLGIARQIRDAMVLQDETNAQNAAGKFWMVDRYGLIKDELGDKIREGFDRDFVRKQADGEEWGEKENYLLEVVKKVKPTVLIGTSTCPGAFTEEIVKEMSKHVDRPIIFPVSLKVHAISSVTTITAVSLTPSPID